MNHLGDDFIQSTRYSAVITANLNTKFSTDPILSPQHNDYS
jgi:hypothetical protein